MTAADEQGKVFYRGSKVFMPQSTNSLNDDTVYGPTHKLGIIRDTSLQPFAPRVETFEVTLPRGVVKVRVFVALSYQPRPGDIYPIHKQSREITVPGN